MRAGGFAWLSFLAGLASVATLPVAIYLTRFSDSYDLLHAGFAIPLGLGLGVVAIALSRRARRRAVLRPSRIGLAHAGRVAGIVGVCMALAAIVSLGVYGLLEYVGSRE